MKTLSRAVILAFSFLLFPAQLVLAQLLIVEVQVYGEKTDNDFIKIYNTTDNGIDISGYKFKKRVSTGSELSIRVFPNGSTISANGYFLWANSQDDFHLSASADVWSTATLAKNNSVALLTPDNVIIDSLAWGESQNPFVKGVPYPESPGPNQQLKRKLINGNYQDTNSNSQDFYLSPSPEPSQPQTEQSSDEPQPEPKSQPNAQQTAETLSEPQQQTASPTTKLKTAPATKEPELIKIDINTASAQELQKLAGIGSILAQRIIDARPFYSVDELTKVKGIGSKTLQDIKSQGLAWVDPSLRPPKIEKEAESLTKGAAAIAEPIKAFDYPTQKSGAKPLSVFLVALGLAIFSGAIILIFKNKLKKEL